MPEKNTPKYKIRFILNDYDVTYKMIITHPMETGYRLNKQTGEKYPTNYLESVSWFIEGELIMRFLIGPHVSKNPYFSF